MSQASSAGRRIMPAREALERLNAAAVRLGRAVQFMEVCGTHTVNAFRSGLHSLTPANVTLLSGPGCPVCVTSQGDIDLLLDAAERPDVMVCTYGDMLRVPGSGGTLEAIRSRGADIRVIYSSMDAVKLAKQNPDRLVVLAAVGFETTAPATAVAVLTAEREGVANFCVLASHKLIYPAMKALLDSGRVNVDGFLCPGHVAVVVGADAFAPVVANWRLPCVISGFEDAQIAAALARLTELVADGQVRLENQYPQAVTPAGNKIAQTLLEQVFEPVDTSWRGLGALPLSGLGVREGYARFDARKRLSLTDREAPEPPGCRCGEVICGVCTPADCRLFGTVCTPTNPIGPCMVSGEGTCQAWFKYRRNRRADRQEVQA